MYERCSQRLAALRKMTVGHGLATVTERGQSRVSAGTMQKCLNNIHGGPMDIVLNMALLAGLFNAHHSLGGTRLCQSVTR